MASPSRARVPPRIAIDSGGTFTDCVWLANSTLRVLKVFSSPQDPSLAIAEAVGKIVAGGGDVTILHGTTVGTNTLLQRKRSRVGLVTTPRLYGFIEIGPPDPP